ncbi:hypothetical protein ASL14_09335 [Paenibacillus sp. IHB B 3084]|uniref:hypothetical protein n=1 Tax=Paenibacillus sp. IHB B 3084 TaxID=867076 RepID=UPI00071F4A9B|nr:hypothetical protein [Paenibacillus sp. IHB B 3084]ALP36341.1 hypothetical protein ASL14_09335 [Paenibacillus sp. IHB B 3084]
MDQINADLERATEIGALLAQAIPDNLPGNYRFSSDYPDQYAAWSEIASRFERSNIYTVRMIGYNMRRLSNAMERADTETGNGRNGLRQRGKVHKAVHRLAVASTRHRKWVERNEL